MIENALSKEKGIEKANVNLATEKVYLEFDPALIGMEKIKEIIKNKSQCFRSL